MIAVNGANALKSIADLMDAEELEADQAAYREKIRDAEKELPPLQKDYDIKQAAYEAINPHEHCGGECGSHDSHLEATCTGCGGSNVYSCTHECPLTTPLCSSSSCSARILTDYDRALHKEVLCSCNNTYHLCDSDVEMHRSRICSRAIYGLDYYGNYVIVGFCNNSYRDCTKSQITCNAAGLSGYCSDGGSFTGLCPNYDGASHVCILCCSSCYDSSINSNSGCSTCQ